MSAPVQVAMAFGSVAVLLGLMALVRRLAGTCGLGAEVQRKLVHMGTGLFALSLPWMFPDRWPIYMLIAITLVVMLFLRLPGVARAGLGAALHSVERRSYGDILLAIAVGLCLFLAEDRLFLYVLPIAVLTLADAAAALAGSTYGKRFFRVEDGMKSVEGCAVFFAVTLVISVLCLSLMTPMVHANIVVLSLMVAGFGTLVEAASWRGFDNLFLPVGLLIFLSVHGDDSLADLVMLASVFVASLVLFRLFAQRFGIGDHASRVYVTTVFLLLAVTAFQNALFPVLALAAHVWSQRANPCRGRFSDLDIVAALVLISLFWLTVGNGTGMNAVSYYGVATMALALGLAATAMGRWSIRNRVTALLVLAGALCLIRGGIVATNPPEANWNGAIWTVALASLLATGLPPGLFPAWFGQDRVARLSMLAMAVPFFSYLVATKFLGLMA